MKRIMMVLILSIACAGNGLAQSWVLIQTPEIARLTKPIDSPSPALAALGANSFMQSTDQGKTWQAVSGISGRSEQLINVEILTRPQLRWFLLSSRSLSISDDNGKSWRRIFEPVGNFKSIFSLAQDPIDPRILYVGTSRGVYKSKDFGLTWNRAFGELTHQPIYQIVIDLPGQNIYFASARSLYRYHLRHDTFREIFSRSIMVNEIMEDEMDEFVNAESTFATERIHIALSAQNENSAMIASGKNVFVSNDEGETWSELPSFGLNLNSIRGLIYSQTAQSLFVSSDTKIFRFNSTQKIWSEIYDGLAAQNIYHLSAQEKPAPKILAATDQGLFAYEVTPELRDVSRFILGPERLEMLKELFSSEPSVTQVQRIAVDYANVNNSKIKYWHVQSRLRSLIPSITFSKDLDIGNNIHVDTGSTTVPDIFVQGPDDRSKSTDLNISWNLADLVWSSSQTSIDSREKLMIELRDQILSEVTRIYFERKRTVLTLVSNPPEAENERINLLIRIQELTANLDALTEGYYSRELDKLAASRANVRRFYDLFETG